MSCGEKGTVWSDESASSYGDGTRIEKGAVEVDVHTLSKSAQYMLPRGRCKERRHTPQVDTIVYLYGTVDPCITVEEPIIFLLRRCSSGERRLIAENTRK